MPCQSCSRLVSANQPLVSGCGACIRCDVFSLEPCSHVQAAKKLAPFPPRPSAVTIARISFATVRTSAATQRARALPAPVLRPAGHSLQQCPGFSVQKIATSHDVTRKLFAINNVSFHNLSEITDINFHQFSEINDVESLGPRFVFLIRVAFALGPLGLAQNGYGECKNQRASCCSFRSISISLNGVVDFMGSTSTPFYIINNPLQLASISPKYA